MLPKMQDTGYRQIYTVLYVITLCCCFSFNAQGRTLTSLESLGAVSGPSNPTANNRFRRTLSDLENILGTLERNRNSYEEAVFGRPGVPDVGISVGESDFDASPSSSRASRFPSSLEQSQLLARLTEKRGQRPCYWNVVACYGK